MFFQTRKRMREIIEDLERIASGDLGRKVTVYSPRSLNRLSSALEAALGRLHNEIVGLKAENTRLAGILESMVEGVILLDHDSRIIAVNPAAEKIFSIAAPDVRGKYFLEAVNNNDLQEIISRVLDEGGFVSKELTLVWPVQKIFQVNASSPSQKEAAQGCLLVIHDVTEMRKLELMRRDFIANISHELKTPLTSIKGFVETLIDGALDDREHSRQFLQIIQAHTERLNRLITDLLSLSYLESREIALQRQTIDLRQLTGEILAGFGAQLREKRLTATNELPEPCEASVDRDRIEQVLTNLIDNAIKFNKENGWLKITCRKEDSRLVLSVQDSGTGIPAPDAARIFERFYRVDKARSRALGGTGLGLSIVKHCVELHGGTVGVESVEGLGSKFWFSIPL